MGYAEFNPVVKKLNLKPKGEVEVVLTTSLSNLRGSVETLSDMIDQKVHLSLESTVVSYNVQVNARTEIPIKRYRVDERGIVEEIKPEGEQLELDLGPKDVEPVKDDPREISREVVDEFILSGLAPLPEKHWYPINEWIGRLRAGETYLKFANEIGMSGSKIIDLIDEYRQAVAPLAAKWDEWRQTRVDQGNDDTPPPAAEGEDQSDAEESGDGSEPEGADPSDGDDFEMEDGEPDYTGKEVVITQIYEGFRKEVIEIIFPIIGGTAGLPSFFLDGRFDRIMDEREVLDRIGVAPLPRQDGEVRYLVGELLGAFGGELRDVDPYAGELTEEDEEFIDSLPDAEEEISDWEREITGESEPEKPIEKEVTRDQIEAFILREKPSFEDMEYDFPELLRRRREDGESWMEIAGGLGMSTSALQGKYQRYKQRVTKMIRENGAA